MPLTPYYDDGTCVIYHGDCRDVLPELKGDVVLTDPPFGVRRDSWDSFETDAHLLEFTGDWMRLALRAAPILAMFWPDRYLPVLMLECWKRSIPYRRSLIWRKPSGSQMGGASMDGFWFDFETVYVFGAKPNLETSTSLRFSVMEARTLTGQEHGCEKPESVYGVAIAGYSRPSGVVIDPFAGTGTSLVSAKRSGRRAIGVEATERYCEIAAKRLAQGALPLEMGA